MRKTTLGSKKIEILQSKSAKKKMQTWSRNAKDWVYHANKRRQKSRKNALKRKIEKMLKPRKINAKHISTPFALGGAVGRKRHKMAARF